MAEAEGKANDGQQSKAESVENINAELQIAAQDRAAFSAEAYTMNTDPQVMDQMQLGWAQAVAKDERAQKRQHSEPPSSRSWQSRRAQARAKQDWHRTVRGIQRQYRDTPPSSPREPYGGGSQERFWGKVTWGLFRLLGLD